MENQIQKNQQSSHALEWQRSPQQYLQAIKPKSAIDIVNSKNKSLIRLENESSEIAVKALLSILLIDTIDFLNVGKTMNDRQIAQTVELILEDYSVYKIDYFVLCFNRAKKGCYGKLFDRIDGQIILGWLSAFDLEYQQEIETERINEKKRIERDVVLSPEDQPAPMPENVKQLIETIKSPIMTVRLPTEKTKDQIIIDDFIQEFNVLCGEETEKPGKRFVRCNDRMMDIQEYIEFRILNR